MHLKENETNVHIEARVNWDIKNTPKASPEVALLHIYISHPKLQTKKLA